MKPEIKVGEKYIIETIYGPMVFIAKVVHPRSEPIGFGDDQIQRCKATVELVSTGAPIKPT